MTFRDFIRILTAHGFVPERQRGSHRIYKGEVAGRARLVVVAYHREGDEIRAGTLASMVRQSGLQRELFRY